MTQAPEKFFGRDVFVEPEQKLLQEMILTSVKDVISYQKTGRGKEAYRIALKHLRSLDESDFIAAGFNGASMLQRHVSQLVAVANNGADETEEVDDDY